MPIWKRVVVAVAALAAIVTVALYARTLWGRHPRAEPDRSERQQLISVLVPSPIPTSLPLVGMEGRDADGYPTQFPDFAGLRSLLLHQRFDDLTRYFEAYQAKFEADNRYEYWPIDAAHTFNSAEPELDPLLEAWSKHSPDSFAPELARAAHSVAVGFARRGGKWASETSAGDMNAMEEAFKGALRHLDRAAALRPGLVAGRGFEINVLYVLGRDPRPALNAALRICPSCFRVRVSFIKSLRPRWGGSYEAMAAFANESAHAENPRLRLLAGYVDHDKAETLAHEKKLDDALAAIERACALGEFWDFLDERAKIQTLRGDLEKALADADRALELRPGSPEVLFERAEVHGRAKRFEAAGRDLLEGLKANPTDPGARRIASWVARGLAREGWRAHTEGRRDDALRCLDLAAVLAPGDAEIGGWRARVIEAGGKDLAALEAASSEAPDDFQAAQRLDYALARKGEFAKVVQMWDAFLGRHPDHGRAHLERGGALFHLRRLADAHSAAQKACELGVSEGCARARQLAGSLK
jgi:tetratricopeptide (TPR) repeat protein